MEFCVPLKFCLMNGIHRSFVLCGGSVIQCVIVHYCLYFGSRSYLQSFTIVVQRTLENSLTSIFSYYKEYRYVRKCILVRSVLK